MLTGEPGLGRTALLRHLAGAFVGGVFAGGVFAGGAAYYAPVVPPRLRDEVLGPLYAGHPADRLCAALLRAAAASGPLLVCVDDLHLWPAATRRALTIVARGLADGRAPVALFLSVAAHRSAAVPDDLPVLRLGPLDDTAADALLSRLGVEPPGVRERLVRAAGGSPLVLRELAAGARDLRAGGARGVRAATGADRVRVGLPAPVAEPRTPAATPAPAPVPAPADRRVAQALRLVEAAERARLAGRPDRAARLLAPVRRLALPDEVTGRAELVHGLLEMGDGPVADARASLLLAARLLASHDPSQALRARLSAAEASWSMGDAAAYREALAPVVEGVGNAGVGVEGARVAVGLSDGEASLAGAPADVEALGAYLRGMDAVLSGDPRGFAAGRGALRRVVEAVQGEDDAQCELLLCASAAALVVGDLTAAGRLGSRALATARARGRLTAVPRALEQLAYGELRAGRHALARAHAEEGVRTARLTGRGNDLAHHQAILALVASLDQDARTVAALATAAEETAVRHGLVQTATLAQWALARADLARGRPQEAAARLQPLIATGHGGGHFGIRMLAVPCFVEASVLAGRPDEVAAAVGEFARWAGFGHDPQAPAQLLRCRALLAADDPAQAARLYPEALARHDSTDGDFERARTALLYGKWLRRARRTGTARDALRDALIAFERCGAGAWAAQAAAELRATGEAAAPELPDSLHGLTPQQRRIARLVAEGSTNREVARHLSLSPRTVDHHLRNVFAALGVRSRVELSRVVAEADSARADA